MAAKSSRPWSRAARTLFAVGLALAGSAPALAADDLEAELAAAARVGDRPAECGGGAATALTRWERARVPGLGPYCDALSRGLAVLVEAPDQALASAARAESALPGRAAPLVLSGRARARMRDFAGAYAAFDQARTREGRSVGSPGALLDLGHAALRTGHPDEALAAYRALVPRLAWLSDERQRTRALIEAGVLSMSLGEGHLAEATGYLLEARRGAREPGAGDYVAAALALAKLRTGQASAPREAGEEGPGPARLEAERALVSSGKGAALLELPDAELDALVAVLAEAREPDLAIQRWEAYLTAKGPRPAAHEALARARLELLHRPGRKSR